MIANLQPVIIKLSYWECELPFTYLTNQNILNYQITVSCVYKKLFILTDDNRKLMSR